MSIFKSISGETGIACGAVQYYHQQCEQRVSEVAPRLRQLLREAGVAQVRSDYDGEGDSGQFEAAIFHDANGAQMNGVKHLEGEVQNLFYDLLETRYGGWENNEGAFGTFVWDVVNDRLEHEHSERFMECSTSTHHGFGVTDAGEPS